MSKSKNIFDGNIDELIHLIRELGFLLISKEESDGRYTLRTSEGGIVNWWPSTKTVQCQGVEEEKSRLELALKEYQILKTL